MQNTNSNRIFLKSLLIQNYSKLSITEKNEVRPNNQPENSIRTEFAKKTSMSNFVESLEHIKCCSSSSPRPVKSPILLVLSLTVTRSAVEQNHTGNQKNSTFLKMINKPIIIKFFKDFTYHRRNTNRVVFFSRIPLPNILKYIDQRWDLRSIWKTRFFQTRIEKCS